MVCRVDKQDNLVRILRQVLAGIFSRRLSVKYTGSGGRGRTFQMNELHCVSSPTKFMRITGLPDCGCCASYGLGWLM